MDNLLVYLVESSVCIILLTSFYYLLLRGETFFQANRFYLLASIFLSLFLPLLNIPTNQNFIIPAASNLQAITVNSLQFLQNNIIQMEPIVVKSSENGWNYPLVGILTIIYLAGVVLKLSLFTGKITKLVQTILKSPKFKEGEFYFIVTENKEQPTYSFFNYIFINDTHINTPKYKQIIDHEKIHATQRHSVDLLITELFIVFQWVNPFIYLLRKAVVENHEYQADKSVIQNPENKNSYLKLILNQVLDNQYFRMTSSFNYSLSKKRIKMLTKIQSSKLAKIKFLAIIPLLSALLLLFAFCENRENVEETTEKQDYPKNEKAYFKADEMPVYNKKKDKGLKEFREELQENLLYPEEARKEEISGTVFIAFVVDESGKMVNREVIRGAHPTLDQAALEALDKLNDWDIPGKIDGEPVKIQYTVPVVFKLD